LAWAVSHHCWLLQKRAITEHLLSQGHNVKIINKSLKRIADDIGLRSKQTFIEDQNGLVVHILEFSSLRKNSVVTDNKYGCKVYDCSQNQH